MSNNIADFLTKLTLNHVVGEKIEEIILEIEMQSIASGNKSPNILILTRCLHVLSKLSTPT